MAVQVNLESEPFFTKFWLKLLWGPYPQNWSPLAHRSTGWIYWDQPDGERIDCWKCRQKWTEQPNKGESAWPVSKGIRNGSLVEVPISAQKLTFGVDIWQGSYQGEPLQIGTTNSRSVSYGYIVYGEKKFGTVPLPASGTYIHCGDPNIASDRHVNVVDPVSGEVYELIQFDENANETAVANQALGWTKWKNGQQIAGGTANATSSPMHGFMWGFTSSANPHALGLVLPDYVGADGTLTEGPKAGSWGYLPSNSASYNAMINLGGECAAIARAANVFGFKIVDRSGYEDTPNTAVGTKLRPSALWIQWGSAWRKTNINKLNIPLADLRILQ